MYDDNLKLVCKMNGPDPSKYDYIRCKPCFYHKLCMKLKDSPSCSDMDDKFREYDDKMDTFDSEVDSLKSDVKNLKDN